MIAKRRPSFLRKLYLYYLNVGTFIKAVVVRLIVKCISNFVNNWSHIQTFIYSNEIGLQYLDYHL